MKLRARKHQELADELGIQAGYIYKWISSQKTFTNSKPIISKKAELTNEQIMHAG